MSDVGSYLFYTKLKSIMQSVKIKILSILVLVKIYLF